MKKTSQQVIFDGRDQEVIIRQKTTRRLKTPFSAVAPFRNKNHRRRNMDAECFDLLDLLEKVSHPALKVFNNLKFNRDEETNITEFVPDEPMNKTEREGLSRRVRELKDVDLVRSVKKEMDIDGTTYTFKDPRKTLIINPEMLRCGDHSTAEKLWECCK